MHNYSYHKTSISMWLILTLIAMSMLGCMATKQVVLGEEMETLLVCTDPPGATASCGHISIKTPGALKLSSQASQIITITKPGFETAVIKLDSEGSWERAGISFVANTAAFGWWSLGIGTAAGMFVDWVSGSLKEWELDDGNEIHINLYPKSPENPTEPKPEGPKPRPYQSHSGIH